MDRDWAIEELRAFLRATDQVGYDNTPGSGVVVLGTHSRESGEKIAERAHVVEQILDRTLRAWREEVAKEPRLKGSRRWASLREWAARGLAALERETELAEKLGDVSPQMSAGGLHPWVWEPAMKLWQDGHFRAALHTVASSLTSQVQAKTGRFDVADKTLFEQTLSLSAPTPGKPRLRVVEDDGSPTYRSVQEGAMHFGVGLCQGVRNVTAHETDELDEQVALERLAAYSVLARWIDGADVAEAVEV
ncbi:TIGR02391 family protein [Cellulomonas sp. JH27-2]|uniref:TIGR02391 family protein n=1 Tax=Cellulomonas sp. JH27-2 TaxID=2774139 RepID=UPI001782D65A|nr:TIGR02391 family protein [Cellulomonas sp. JH27-2]MBD8059044.1 TIGR02391 family protein [Cellulomonas sp. JH27-2]